MQSMTKTAGKTNIKSMIKDARTKSADNILHLLVITNEKAYEEALAVMEYLILNTPDTADNPYHNLMTVLGQAIESYEDKHYPIPRVPAADMLRSLIEEHELKQADLAPILGTASIVSEVLSGKRKLNKRHIEALSKRFHVSPAVFF